MSCVKLSCQCLLVAASQVRRRRLRFGLVRFHTGLERGRVRREGLALVYISLSLFGRMQMISSGFGY